MNRLSRRNMLRGLGLASLGVVATTRGSRTAMAVSDWSDTSLTYDSSDGTIPSFELNESDIDFQFSWSNFPPDGDSVDVTLEARLPNQTDSTSSYTTVLSGSITTSDESGTGKPITGNDIIADSSFPVSVLSNTPIEANHFSVPSDQSSKTTVVEFRVKFEYGDEVVFRETTCEVTVNKTNNIPDSGKLLEGFEDGDIANYGGGVSNAFVDNSTPFTGTYSVHVRGPKGTNIATTDVDILRGNRYSAWLYGNEYSSTAHQNDIHIFWMAQTATSTPDSYFTELDREDNTLYIRKYPSGDVISSSSVSVSRNTWYEIEFEPMSDGTNWVRVFSNDGGSRGNELVSTSFEDSEYDAGGIGFGHGGDDNEFECIADNVRRWE